MIDRHRQLLLDCYITGQVPEAAWQKHLADDPGLAEFADTQARGLIEAATYGSRERAFAAYMLANPTRPNSNVDYAHELFKAGWNARKLADLRTGFGWRDKL